MSTFSNFVELENLAVSHAVRKVNDDKKNNWTSDPTRDLLYLLA